MKVLSVICARAGSKGLKNKCVEKIGDKMVVQYAIEYSQSLGSSVKTVASTDIEELVVFCEREGVDYIRRPPALCSDESRIDDALAQAIECKGDGYDLCSLVYGNIPTRHPILFEEAVDILSMDGECDAVLSMQNVEKYHPAWMFDRADEILPRKEQVHYRRQKLPQKMIHDGHTLIFRIDDFMRRYRGGLKYDSKYMYSIFGNRIKLLMNDLLIVDIDTGKDLVLAEAVLRESQA